MEFIRKYALISILLVVLAILFFCFYNNNQVFNVYCLSKVDYSLLESVEIQTISKTLEEKMMKGTRMNFYSEVVFDKNDYNFVEKEIKNQRFDLFFLDSDFSDTFFKNLQIENIDANFVTMYFQKSTLFENSLNLMPDLRQVTSALNEFCELNEESVTLIIDEYQTTFDFSGNLYGQVYTFSFNQNTSFKENIDEIINLLGDYSPDVLVLNTNESETIGILDSIVGFPRDRIFLLLQNTNKKTVYYTGSNSYGINGLTITQSLDSVDFSNEVELYKLLSSSIALYINEIGNFDFEKWIKWQKSLNNKSFNIIDKQVYTDLYRVIFDEQGLKVVDTIKFSDGAI